jgi:2'-hydroxyisoflavone reductase
VTTSRRTFLKVTAAAGGAVALNGLTSVASAADWARERAASTEPAKAKLKILILGGTGFTGPEQVEYAIARGHEVTLINRNRTRPDFFKGRVEQLIGDLNGDVSALKGRKFDVVIDNPTTAPAWVRNVAQYMKGNTSQYIFISTISVYPDNSHPGADETDKLTPLPDGLDPYTVPGAEARRYYGALKTESEAEVARQYPGIHTIIRPGLIVGPLDQTDRFTYWPYRIDKGGEVLAPGDGNDPVQFIDSRDLAEWTVRMAENKTTGIYNATGPAKPMTMRQMLEGIRSAIGSNATFTWVPATFLNEHGIRGWRHMTVWIEPRPETAGFSTRSIARAVSKGLTFRPLAVTARDTLAWNKTRPADQLEKLAQGAVGGISPEKEKEVLDAWKAQQKSGGTR